MPNLNQAVLNSKLLRPVMHTAYILPPLTYPGFSHSSCHVQKHHPFLQALLEKGPISVIYYVVGFKALFYLSRDFYIFTYVNVNEKLSQFSWRYWRGSAPSAGSFEITPNEWPSAFPYLHSVHIPSHLHSCAALLLPELLCFFPCG